MTGARENKGSILPYNYSRVYEDMVLRVFGNTKIDCFLQNFERRSQRLRRRCSPSSPTFHGEQTLVARLGQESKSMVGFGGANDFMPQWQMGQYRFDVYWAATHFYDDIEVSCGYRD